MSERRTTPDRREHNHYFKKVAGLEYIDVYRVLDLFNVTDPCVQHAVKKLLVAGGRGAGKDISKDIKEAIDSLTRWQEMRSEDVPTASVTIINTGGHTTFDPKTLDRLVKGEAKLVIGTGDAPEPSFSLNPSDMFVGSQSAGA